MKALQKPGVAHKKSSIFLMAKQQCCLGKVEIEAEKRTFNT